MKIENFALKLYHICEFLLPILVVAIAIILIWIGVVVLLELNEIDAVAPPTEESIEIINKVELEAPMAISAHTFVETSDRQELLNLIQSQIDRENAAKTLLQAAYDLGCDNDHSLVYLAKQEIYEAEEMRLKYERVYSSLRFEVWDRRMERYPVATSIWLYLKSMGLNDHVCAGILGNIMAESGSNGFNIQPTIYSKNKVFYGICQWSNKYYSEIHGADLNTQLKFLKNTIQTEFNSFGRLYVKGFKYSDFISLKNEEETALAFAKCYERCSTLSYDIRLKNAQKAYDYFVNGIG